MGNDPIIPVKSKETRWGEKRGYAAGWQDGYQAALEGKGRMTCDICKGKSTIISAISGIHPCPNPECHQGQVSCCEGSARHGQLPDTKTPRK